MPLQQAGRKSQALFFDTDLSGFKGFVGSDKLSLNNFAGKNIRIAFKYTSENGKSTRWEVDNVIVKANKK